MTGLIISPTGGLLIIWLLTFGAVVLYALIEHHVGEVARRGRR